MSKEYNFETLKDRLSKGITVFNTYTKVSDNPSEIELEALAYIEKLEKEIQELRIDRDYWVGVAQSPGS